MIFLASLLLASHQERLSATAPVSQAEAFAVLSKVEDAMCETLRVKHLARPKIDANSDNPLDREDLIDEFWRVESAFEKHYKVTPRMQYLDLTHLKLSQNRREESVKMIKLGFIDTLSPVVVGPSSSLSPDQFSIALGYFIERWADRVHMPSIEWSPYLQPFSVPAAPKGGQSSERPGPGPGEHAQPQASK